MNVVDSSRRLEYFANGTNTNFFATPILDGAALVVPTISLYEVYKRLFSQRGFEAARRTVITMMRGEVIDLHPLLAIEAAKFSRGYNLSMADSIIYATAQAQHAELWTQDSDFKDLPGVKYIPKKPDQK